MLNETEIKLIYIKCIEDMNELLYKDMINIFNVELLIEDITEIIENKYETMGYYCSEYESNYDNEDNLVNEELDGKTVIALDKNSCIDEECTYNLIAHELCHYICDRITKKYHSSFCTDTSPMFCLIVRWFNNNGFNIEMNKNYAKLFEKYQPILCNTADTLDNNGWCIIKRQVEDMSKIIKYNEFLYCTNVGQTIQEMFSGKTMVVHFKDSRANSLAKIDKNWVHVRLGLDINFANYNDYINILVDNAKNFKIVNEWNF